MPRPSYGPLTPSGMSKQTAYGKIYHPDVRFVRTSARVHYYPADVVLPTDAFLLHPLMVKIRPRGCELCPRHIRVVAEINK
jgi:hypothetical protein